MHLTPEQIERFADERLAPTPKGSAAQHLATCARCQEEVEFLRTLIARYLKDSSSGLAKLLLARVETETAIAIEPQALFSWDYRERMSDAL